MTPELLRQIADEIERRKREEDGDGKAVFMTDMTDEEYAIHVIEEDHGWRTFYDKVLGRGEVGGTPIDHPLESHPVTGSDPSSTEYLP